LEKGTPLIARVRYNIEYLSETADLVSTWDQGEYPQGVGFDTTIFNIKEATPNAYTLNAKH
jgi:hypothetical protein